MTLLARAAVGLALLATAGCASQLQPAIQPPSQFITLSAHYGAGKIEPPEPSRTVTLPARPYDLTVTLVDYPGFAWQIDPAQNPTMLPEFARMGPPTCPTGMTGCTASQTELYGAESSGPSGKTTLVFTLVATKPSSPSPVVAPSASAAADAPACPAGITAPPPPSDYGCVLGRVTVTVVVP